MLIKINAKCSDLFTATLWGNSKEDTSFHGEYSGYVPDFFPGEHFGDYVELEIDTETGKIVNWKKPTKTELKMVFGKGAK